MDVAPTRDDTDTDTDTANRTSEVVAKIMILFLSPARENNTIFLIIFLPSFEGDTSEGDIK